MSFDDVVSVVAASSRVLLWFHTRRGSNTSEVKVPVRFQTEGSKKEQRASGIICNISTGIGTVAIQRSLAVGK